MCLSMKYFSLKKTKIQTDNQNKVSFSTFVCHFSMSGFSLPNTCFCVNTTFSNTNVSRPVCPVS